MVQKTVRAAVGVLAAISAPTALAERRSHEAGFDFHLVKPVEPAALEKLLAIVPSALDTRGSAPV